MEPIFKSSIVSVRIEHGVPSFIERVIQIEQERKLQWSEIPRCNQGKSVITWAHSIPGPCLLAVVMPRCEEKI